jgi:uncharacterized protein
MVIIIYMWWKKHVNLFAKGITSMLYLINNCKKMSLSDIEKKRLILAVLSTGGFHKYTPVQIQKLFFLIDKLIGKKINGPYFDFVPYHYGPFDKRLYVLLDELSTEGDIVINYNQFSTHNEFFLTEQGLEKGKTELMRFMEEEIKDIRKLNDFVQSLSFSQLVASVYKAFPEMKKNSIFNS